MNISSFPECCAYKIASDLYHLSNDDIRILFEYLKVNPHSSGAEYNNFILMAFNEAEVQSLMHLKTVIERSNKGKPLFRRIKLKLLNKHVNYKSGRAVFLYMLYVNKTRQPLTKQHDHLKTLITGM